VNAPAEIAVDRQAHWEAAVRSAWAEHARTGQPVMELLQQCAALGPEDFLLELSAYLRIAPITLEEMKAMEAAFDVLPYADAMKRGCVALRGGDGEWRLVLADPYDAATRDWAEERLKTPFSYCLANRADVVAFLAQQEEQLRAMDGIVSGTAEGGATADQAEEISIEAISGTDSAVIKLVSSTLYDALKSGASDIHLESTATGLMIKYRIDGVLVSMQSAGGTELAEQVISRIKVMSELDIAERRVPQDGRFKARSKGRDIDFRVSVMPSVFGEDAVLRILDKRSLTDQLQGLTFNQLGFADHIIETLRRVSAAPYGMFLVTGPTGSGKTTTLYAAISEINTGLDKIVTIEDPVEYQLPGVLQIPVNERKGLTFARGLRSILRHDPDRIMVGEIRDPETAEIAVQSALTGHLVYTTVHANNAFDVIGRFMHMGVDTYNFVSSLNAVLAQRLIRVNCANCTCPHAPDAALLRASGLAPEAADTYVIRRGAGCAACRGAGFKGRKAIAELLIMNDELRELIVAREPLRHLKEAARKTGTQSLRESALALVAAGETTLEEINRVTFVA
jgi:general secretion pathway protein E